MTIIKLNASIEEARKFLRLASELYAKKNTAGSDYYTEPKLAGAVRRASMDLTRSLAELRKY